MLRVFRPEAREEREAFFDFGAHCDAALLSQLKILFFSLQVIRRHHNAGMPQRWACLHAPGSVRNIFKVFYRGQFLKSLNQAE
jgi:hypothetical protein